MANDDLSGTSLGDFDLLEVLGRGGFATVYRARQRSLGREVAVKVLHPLLARDPGTAARFEREGRSAAQLEHPRIVGVYTAGHDGDAVYLAMRLVRGTTLEARIEQGPLERSELVDIIAAVAEALEHAHARGLVHRDVKPANILLDSGGAYLSDFGIAVAAEEAGRYTRGGIGTVDYIPPEQADGGPLTPQADLYALGCTAYHALTGAPPFRRPSQLAVLLAHARDPAPPLGDPRLDAFFTRALAKSPTDRFADAASFVDAFRTAALAQDAAPAVGERAAPDPTAGGGRRGAGVAAALLVGVVLVAGLGVGAWWVLRDGDDPDREGPADTTALTAPSAVAAEPVQPSDPQTSGSPPSEAPGPFVTPAAGSSDPDPAQPPSSAGPLAVLGTAARLAFVDTTGGNFDLFTARGDGSDLQQVTEGPWRDWHPAWSPDHSRIVFSSNRGQEPDAFSLFVVDATGGEPQRLTDGTADHDPDWSPDGSQVVFWRPSPAGDADLFLLDLADGAVRRLGGTPGNDLRPVWIPPDGTEIAFMSDDGGDLALHTIRADGTGQRVLHDVPGVDDKNPTPTPDGRELVFNQSDGPVLRLSLQRPGGAARPVLGGEVLDDPHLAPGGTAVVAVRELGPDRTEIVTAPLDGSGRSFSFGEHLREPAW